LFYDDPSPPAGLFDDFPQPLGKAFPGTELATKEYAELQRQLSDAYRKGRGGFGDTQNPLMAGVGENLRYARITPMKDHFSYSLPNSGRWGNVMVSKYTDKLIDECDTQGKVGLRLLFEYYFVK
jgi:hypothetical protein